MEYVTKTIKKNTSLWWYRPWMVEILSVVRRCAVVHLLTCHQLWTQNLPSVVLHKKRKEKVRRTDQKSEPILSNRSIKHFRCIYVWKTTLYVPLVKFVVSPPFVICSMAETNNGAKDHREFFSLFALRGHREFYVLMCELTATGHWIWLGPPGLGLVGGGAWRLGLQTLGRPAQA